MSVPLKYVASSGNEYDLKSDGIRTKTANYHKWNWGVNGTALQFGARVANFKRSPATYTTRLIFNGSINERKTLIENLHEDFELDVRNMQTGRIIWGDYYIDCYITTSSTAPDRNDLWTDNDITIYCPYPFWITENTKSFSAQEAPEEQEFLDYAFGYEYDFFLDKVGVSRWVRDFPFASEFKLTIYGPTVNPRISINGYPYQVFDTIENSGWIIIDSRKNTVIKHLSSGYDVSIFDNRNKVESVFQQIPGGTLQFDWSGSFGFDLTIFEERSEPRWTV